MVHVSSLNTVQSHFFYRNVQGDFLQAYVSSVTFIQGILNLASCKGRVKG
jgi:hypothetical protein